MNSPEPCEGSEPSEGYYLSLSYKDHFTGPGITPAHNPENIYP